jgi:CubicO group peptidase (beta-lactamase class C family)
MTLSLAASAAPCPTRSSWPTTDWPVKLVDPVAKAAEVKALEDFAFTLVGGENDRKGFHTEGLVIIKGGVIVYERYARGFDATKRHISWSVAKSFSTALVGVGVMKGALTLEDSICDHLKGYSGAVCDIKVKDLITFGTGFDWQEGYENESYQLSSVIAMLYGVGHKDQVGFVMGHKIVGEPGKRWVYSTGDAHVVAALAKNALLEKGFGPDAFWTLLFDKIGAGGLTFEEDAKGSPLGGSYVFATPRDFAKFGYLFLNDGCWAGDRLLPEGWVAASVVPSSTFKSTRAGDYTTDPSGYMWWLNAAVPEVGLESPWKDAPIDSYAAEGHWGQKIIVIPSEDVVIVRTGDDREGSIPENDLIKFALPVTR